MRRSRGESRGERQRPACRGGEECKKHFTKVFTFSLQALPSTLHTLLATCRLSFFIFELRIGTFKSRRQPTLKLSSGNSALLYNSLQADLVARGSVNSPQVTFHYCW